MASAKSFDQFLDVGMAFSEEEVAEYSIDDEAQKRLEHLEKLWMVLTRYSEIPGGQVNWASRASRETVRMANWLSVAVSLPQLPWEMPEGEDLKPITKIAQQMDVADYVKEERDLTEALLRRCVTIGRLAETKQGWKKVARSRSNKFCNALLGEYRKIEGWTPLIYSMTAGSAKKIEEED